MKLNLFKKALMLIDEMAKEKFNEGLRRVKFGK
jgi:hypothetical protein